MSKPVLFAWEMLTWLNRWLAQLEGISCILVLPRLREYPEPMNYEEIDNIRIADEKCNFGNLVENPFCNLLFYNSYGYIWNSVMFVLDVKEK